MKKRNFLHSINAYYENFTKSSAIQEAENAEINYLMNEVSKNHWLVNKNSTGAFEIQNTYELSDSYTLYPVGNKNNTWELKKSGAYEPINSFKLAPLVTLVKMYDFDSLKTSRVKMK